MAWETVNKEMKLKLVKEIEAELNARIGEWEDEMRTFGFSPEDANLSSLKLMPGGLSEVEVIGIEKSLGFSLAGDFRCLLTAYHLNGFEICDVVIGGGASFAEFIDEQLSGDFWSALQKPRESLFFGSASGYVFILNCKTGCVLSETIDSKNIETLASSFEVFLQALGTMFLEAPSGLDESEFMMMLMLDELPQFWKAALKAASKRKGKKG